MSWVLVNRLTSDATLVRRALADTPAAFEALVERYQRQAAAIARALGVPKSSVDDVVQESLLQAFSGLRNLRSPESFGSWLLCIVRNLSRKEIEASRRTFDAARLASSLPPDASPGSSSVEELEDRIWSEVSKLPEGMREAIFLYYHEGECVRRVARALSISTSAAKSRLQRGRDLLRENLWRELGDSLREMLPSAREWKQRARKLSLVLGAVVLPEEATASAVTTGAIEPPSGLIRLSGLGITILSAKKLIAFALLGALLVAGAITGAGFLIRASREGQRLVEGGRGMPPSPIEKDLPNSRQDGRDSKAERSLAGISGTVFRENSASPLREARVALIPEGVRRHERIAVTGEDGAYSLEDLNPGKYRLWAWLDDWVLRASRSEEIEIDVQKGQAIEGKDLFLVPGVIVVGQVVEEGTRMPIAGASVQFEGLQFATADAEGRFRLEGVPEGHRGISARAGGYAKRRVAIDAAHGETPSVTLELEPGGTIEGTVTDLTGAPASGVEVSAETWSVSIWERAKTDAAGRYRIDGMPVRARDIEVTASRGGRFAAHAFIPGFPPGSDKVTKDLRLERGFVYRGRVLDPSRQPVEGAELNLLGSMGFDPLRTDADGRFVIEGASERMSSLSVSRKGHAPASVDLRDLPPEARETIEIVLRPGRVVEGIVVDSRGPVEGVSVQAELEDDRIASRPPCTFTDASGRFRLEDLPEGPCGIFAFKDGYVSSRGNPARPDQRDVRIVLEEVGHIEGVVSDEETGASVHPFVVKVDHARGEDFRAMNKAKRFPGGLGDYMGTEGLHFDLDDGWFRIRNGLAPGTFYQVMVVAPGYMETVLDGVEAWPRSTPGVPLRIQLERGGELRGKVRASDGEAIAGVRVSHIADLPGEGQDYWRDSDRGEHSPVRVAVTDVEGSFVIDGLPGTPGILLLEKSGFARTAVFLVTPSAEVQVYGLEPEAVLEGTCRGADGEPLRGAGIEVSVEGVSFPSVWTDARGSFRMGGLPAGTADVVMRHHGSLEKHRAATLGSGEVTAVEFSQQGGSILGCVTDGGRPVPEAKVLVKSLSNAKQQEYLRSDDRGSFRAVGLDPGTYELKAWRSGKFSSLEAVSRKVEVGTSEVLCEISLSPAGGLGGLVIDRLTGIPVPGAGVTVFKHRPGFFSGGGFSFPGSDWEPSGFCEAEADARFRTEPSSAGTYLLAARGGEGDSVQGWLGPLELQAGDLLDDLTIELGGPGSLSVTVREAATGAPIEGCGIVLAPPMPVRLYAKTGGSGSARLSKVPAGKYRLEVQPPRHASFFEDIVVGAEPLEREILLAPASWIAVDLVGARRAPSPCWVKATLISGGDPAWPHTSIDGASATWGSTAAAEPRQRGGTASSGIQIRLKTSPGPYRIRFEVTCPYVTSPVILTMDLDVNVPEAGEASVTLALPE